MRIYQDLLDKKAKLGVIGLGYVGLPLALEFAKTLSVIGFDTNREKIARIGKRFDEDKVIDTIPSKDGDIEFTNDPQRLNSVNFFIVTVPTSVDRYNVPDLKPLMNASSAIGKALKKGDYVVYESTTYPGCTEEDCLPVLEEISRLSVGKDFKLGYSPERINTGDKTNTLRNVVKVVSGNDDVALEEIALVYELIVDAGVHRAVSIKVSEASKVVENTQRDMNIALMNEFSLIFDRMGINTYDVLDAAGTKWNFMKFQPGLVGGHCIAVDPYYLTYKAASLGYQSRVIAASRVINDDMAKYLARKIIKYVLQRSDNPRILVMGVTFKENVSDIRNSKIVDTVRELLAFNIHVDVEDPYAAHEEVKAEYGLELTSQGGKDYDAVIITVPHTPYRELNDIYFASITRPHGVIVDLKGIYRNNIHSRPYWTL